MLEPTDAEILDTSASIAEVILALADQNPPPRSRHVISRKCRRPGALYGAQTKTPILLISDQKGCVTVIDNGLPSGSSARLHSRIPLHVLERVRHVDGGRAALICALAADYAPWTPLLGAITRKTQERVRDLVTEGEWSKACLATEPPELLWSLWDHGSVDLITTHHPPLAIGPHDSSLWGCQWEEAGVGLRWCLLDPAQQQALPSWVPRMKVAPFPGRAITWSWQTRGLQGEPLGVDIRHLGPLHLKRILETWYLADDPMRGWIERTWKALQRVRAARFGPDLVETCDGVTTRFIAGSRAVEVTDEAGCWMAICSASLDVLSSSPFTASQPAPIRHAVRRLLNEGHILQYDEQRWRF